MKKLKNSSIDKLKLTDNKVKKLWRNIVIIRAKGKCQYPGCECTKSLNAHHIIDKQIHLLRYDEENGLALCFYHHKMGLISAHKDPFFIEKMLKAGVLSKTVVEYLKHVFEIELARMKMKIKPKSIKDIRERAYKKLSTYHIC